MKEKKSLIIVGASGGMGQLIIRKATSLGYEIAAAIVGPKDETPYVYGGPSEGIINCQKINEIDWVSLKNFFWKKQLPVIIDATAEEFVKNNWESYYKPSGFPTVFVTTGIKKEDIVDNQSSVFIASPNSCPELVSVLVEFSRIFKGLFHSDNPDKKIYYGISESHQGPDLSIGVTGKKNPSSTAKEMDIHLTNAGFERLYFETIRDEEKQLAMGIKKEDLRGHAWHTYRFMSKEKTSIDSIYYIFSHLMSELIEFGDYTTEKGTDYVKMTNSDESLTFVLKFNDNNLWFSHNVNGRNPYINGLFGRNAMEPFCKSLSVPTPRTYSMIDFLSFN